jgi:hypothetical protein
MVAAPLLLLVARDLLLFDPPRVLAWRLLHEPRLSDLPRWLAALVPRGGPFDRDPLALLLGAICAGAGALLLVAGACRARMAVRAVLLAAGALAAVVVPSIAFVAMGWAIDRPYGQDGGVVQLPLALDLLMEGRSPYNADYSASILGRQARVSPFWQAYGGNPLMRHHAYLPGTHLLMLPGYLASRAAGIPFDPRVVTLAAYLAAALLALWVARGAALGAAGAVAGAALVLVNPLVYWPQVFGANDVVQAALLLLAVLLARRGHSAWSGAVLGLACASKQLAWPYAPFVLAAFSGAATLRELVGAPALRRMARPAVAALAVFVGVVAPVAALDPRGFWQDIVVYNVGLPGADSYPLGGTPGFGFANFLIYAGRVGSLRDHVSFAPFYVLLIPLGLLLLRRQLRHADAAAALVTGSVALLASVYASRVAHPNYLVLAAILLPVGLIACARSEGGRGWTAEAAVAPLLLLSMAVELVEHEPLRAVWEDAVGAHLGMHATGLVAWAWPRASSALTADPLGLLFGALAAGLGVVWLVLAVLGASVRWRLALAVMAVVALVVAPAVVFARVGAATGVPRAQDGWFVAVSHAGRVAAGQTAPAPAREAWSQSFRRDPPGELLGDPVGSPPQRTVGRLLGHARNPDPRPLLALAVLAGGVLAAWRSRTHRPLAVAALALAPVTALGAVFGAGTVLAVALVAGALAAKDRRALQGALLGVAAGLFPRLALALPLLVPLRSGARPWIAAAAGVVATLGLSLLMAGPSWAPPRLEPAVGLPNILLYAGASALPAWLPPLLLVLQLAAVLVLFRVRRGPGPAPIEAAAVLAASLWLSPSATPFDLALPLVLLVMAALPPAAAAAIDTPEPTS